MAEYLTEEKLKNFLVILFPTNTFEHNKQVPNSGMKTRPDFRCDELKLIVEFDGDKHYCEASKIISEENKNNHYARMGYKIVRIPYFVQISTEVIKCLFNLNFNCDQKYDHGFISENVIMPCDYCELGIQKFKNDLKRFHFIRKDIVRSLNSKIVLLKNKDLVLPPSLHDILKE